MENKKDFKILYVGEGKKKMEYNPIYLYSQNLNVIRPFDEAYREINEIAFRIDSKVFRKKDYIYN